MAEQKFEYHDTSGNGAGIITDTLWGGMPFTVGVVGQNKQFTITRVELYLKRLAGLPGVVTASIRATSGGLPTGADLATGTFDGDTISTVDYGWHTINMSGYSLQPDTQYAIVLHTTDNSIYWMFASAGGYTGGYACSSSDSGSSWNDILFADHNYYFEVWGNHIAVHILGNTHILGGHIVG